jgi:hypothetical protein
VTVADSVADFSSTQGYRNWDYGYIDIASGFSFVPFPFYQTNYPESDPHGSPAWVIDPLPAQPNPNDFLFTALWAAGGMDNGWVTSQNQPREQFDDRRWVSDVNGKVVITGLFGNYASALSGQDGMDALILVNGVTVWSFQATGEHAIAPYSVSTTLSAGSIVDFLVEPRVNDFDDEHTFTATMQASAIPGDVNLDGTVNGLDINTVAGHWLMSGGAGDTNGDGIVNGLDINVIATHWLQSIYYTDPTANVPEPCTLTLSLLALVSSLHVLRRWRQPHDCAASSVSIARNGKLSLPSNCIAPGGPSWRCLEST